MSRTIIIERIARRTGIKGIPRGTYGAGVEKLKPRQNVEKAVQDVLETVKRKTLKDGNDRQIKLASVTRKKSGQGHNIKSVVLYRVYRSHSDGKVYVYPGEAHQGARE